MNTDSAALMGFLHDIGKFWQRAEASSTQPLAPGYEAFSRTDYGRNGAHATWSASFIEQTIPPAYREDTSAVLFHHNPAPDHHGAQLIALADRLASGERSAAEQEQRDSLLSLYTRLGGEALPEAYLPLKPLQLDEATLFPLGSEPNKNAVRSDYAALWQAFREEANALADAPSFEALLTTLYGLMERYTWSVPAAFYRSVPDISLFDHSRITAAIAACLCELDPDRLSVLLEQNDHRKPNDDTTVAGLVEGDVSGVQRFIYTITARGATSALRGRSFYLQLLTDAIARYLLMRLGLPITNLIYAGGGRFSILIPPGGLAVVPDIQAELDDILLDPATHDGASYVALGTTALTCADFQQFSRASERAQRALGVRKRRRFAEADHGLLFEARGEGGGNEIECQVCHSEVHVRVDPRSEDGSVRKCSLCTSLEELGRALRTADRLVYARTVPATTNVRTWQGILSRLGLQVSVLSREERHLRPLPQATEATVIGLHTPPHPSEALDYSQTLGCPVGVSFRITVNIAPRRANTSEMATFEDLQDASTGLKRLGVLRMDVDDLGWLFTHGFHYRDRNGKDGSYATLSRVAALSASLSRFFEGWVGVLCQRTNEAARAVGGTEPIYTIYSGGDDLFIVGSWDKLPALAAQIRSDFQRYASGNPRVHLSGGLTLHGGKEPLYQAAEAARDALDSAKALEGKDAFSLLGRAVYWGEFKQVVHYCNEFVDLVSQSQIGRSLLGTLLELDEEQERLRVSGRYKPNQVVWGAHMWRGAYLLRRSAERAGAAKGRISRLVDELQGNNFTNLRLIALAARWAEALTRKERED